MPNTDFQMTYMTALQLRRVRLTLWISAALMVVLGVCWGVFFAVQRQWIMVGVDLIMVAAGLGVWQLFHHKRVRAAFYLMLVSMYLIASGISLVIDIPSAAVPRSTHLFLLLLGICALVFLQNEMSVLRHWAAALCFATFLAFAGYNGGVVTDYMQAEDIRRVGTWVNGAFAVAGIYALVHIALSDIKEKSTLEIELRRGIDSQEFVLLYQPQLTSSGVVVGAEAILRWQHPQRGVVPPTEFIDLAEQTGLMIPLGLQALRMACADLARWSAIPEFSDLRLSVNVSAQQFRQSNFVDQVRRVIRQSGARPQCLKLELTESLLLHDLDDIVSKMVELRGLGVGFSLDDFGTGYSSLSYLKRLPLDQLKIDQSFVADVLVDSHDAAIARTIIGLGKSLGFDVIAEGVETQGQRDFLIANDCHLFQGYFFSKPLPGADFVQFVMASSSTWPK